jgi:anoctamin-10
LAIIYGLFELRKFLFEEWEGKWYQSYVTTIVSTINAIQIFIFNYIYNFVAFFLTSFENHKTETAFERSLITKTFFFQFVNSFNSLFYIAFIKRHEEGCLDDNGSGDLVVSKDNNCFRELNIQLRSIFIIAIFRNVIEIGLPIIFNFLNRRSKSKYYQKLKDSAKDEHKLLARIELSMDKSSYSFGDIDGTYWDYLELVIQAGYLLLFGLAFPLCYLLAFANNIIEHQVDKAKIVHYKRRPQLLGGNSIGVWRIILYFLAGMGVLTHAGLL